MDSELVSGSESTSGRDGGASRPALPFTYAERFEKLFPFYLAIGMTPEQYWDGDASLVRGYRKAFELQQEISNQNAWLQGMYIYEALCCVAPIFRPLSKAKKPIEYRSQPYLLKTSVSAEREEKKKRESDAKAKSAMEMFMIQFNKRFNAKGGAAHGR